MEDMKDDFAGGLMMAWHANGHPRSYNPRCEEDAWRLSVLERMLGEDLGERILSVVENASTMSYFIAERDGTGSVVLVDKARLDNPKPRNNFGDACRYRF